VPASARPPADARGPKGRGYAPAALASEVERVLDAPIGQRNAALNRAAWNLARHIASGILDRGDVEAALQVAGEAAGGQTPASVAATIGSAIDARLRSGL
jgi:putative DNA primase/helicase